LSVDGSELASKDGDLLGGDVVDVDEENLAVLAAALLESVPLLNLLGLGLLSAGLLWHFFLIKFNKYMQSTPT
jgi:hypothetical protein